MFTIHSDFTQGNQIKDEGAEKIAEALKINQSLAVLYLSVCDSNRTSEI